MAGPRSTPATPQHRASPAELLRTLFRYSRAHVPSEQFFPVFLNAVSTALRTPVVCIWRVHEGAAQIVAHRQFDQSGLRPQTDAWTSHQELLAAVDRQQKGARFRPAETTPLGSNPLNMELICVPVTTGGTTRLVVEIVVAAANPAEPKKGRQARLNQLCEYLRDYLQTQEWRQKADLAGVESELRSFASRINAATTTQELAIAAVNEGRQLLGAERVSIGWLSGRKPRILAVSGQESVEPRSNVIQALCRLTKAATIAAVPLQYTLPTPGEVAGKAGGNGAAPDPAADEKSIPDPYERVLANWPATGPRGLLVIPLTQDGLNHPRGALIVERLPSEKPPGFATQRAEFIAAQLKHALPRLELLESIPLSSWWSRSARRGWSRRFWRWLAAIAAAGAIAGLACLPLDLRLPADGELLAESRHTAFAPDAGVVRKVHVEHGGRVRGGDLLLTLENLELSAQLRDLSGQLVQVRERQRSLEARRAAPRLTELEQIEIQSGLVEAAASANHTERQIRLLQQRLDRLQIVAPADGVVTTWNVGQTLLNRTVLPGDALLQQVDTSGRWMIELRIPEDRAGYVSRRLSELNGGERLKVEFVLATQPQRRYSGQLRGIAARTELTADGHIVRAAVDLEPNDLPPLHDGAEVKARVNCGPRPAGFVWFRELIEVVQTYWWY